MPGAGCRLEIAGAWCNNREECLDNIELRFTLSGDIGSVLPVCGRGFRSGNVGVTPRAAGCVSSSTLERYAMVDSSPVFSAFFDRIDIAGMAYARFQVIFPGCVDLDSISVELGAWIGVNPLEYNIGWPDDDTLAAIDPISVTTTIFDIDPCSDSSV